MSEHPVQLPVYRVDEGPAVCLTCGGFLYWRFDQQQWAHVRDMREQDRTTG